MRLAKILTLAFGLLVLVQVVLGDNRSWPFGRIGAP